MPIWLSRLKIQQFRQVEPGTELFFGKGINVLIGENGVGKTNLLELISIIMSGEFVRIKNEDFSMEMDFYFDWKDLNIKEKLFLCIDSKIEIQNNIKWRYSMVFIDENKNIISNVCKKNSDDKNGLFDLFYENFWNSLKGIIVFNDGTNFFSATRMKLDCCNFVRFDEFLNHYNIVFGNNSIVENKSYIEYNFIKNNDEISGTYRYYYIPRYYVDSIVHFIGKHSDIENVDSDILFGKNLIYRFAEYANFKSIYLQPMFVNKSKINNKINYAINGFKTIIDIDGVSTIDGQYMSFGQKRLLSFLWYCDCNPHGPLIVDELANGLHHEWVMACIKEIGERQAFLATQNPLLLDLLSWESPEDVQRRIILCSAVEVEGRRRWRWAAPDAERARQFYEGHDLAVTRNSDLLRVLRLW